MRLMSLIVIASLMLLTSCVPRQDVIPNSTIPHKLAKPTTVTIWTRRSDGKYVEQTITVPAGWWVASPFIVEKQP